MSVAPLPPNALLPQTAGPTLYGADMLYFPCPANGMPWGALHIRPVFLPIKECAKGKKARSKKRLYDSYYVSCSACNFRAFFFGPYWSNGVTREQIVRQFGPGVAVDDRNCWL